MEELRDQLKTIAKIVPKPTPKPVFSGRLAVNAARSKRNNEDIRNEFNELCNEKMRCAKVHKKERIKNIEGKIINFTAKLFGFL